MLSLLILTLITIHSNVIQEVNVPPVHDIVVITATHKKVRDPIYCLAQNIYFEARNQSVEGQDAVAYVVFNRVRSISYPNDICSVIYQPGQFSWTFDSRSNEPKDTKQWHSIYERARTLIKERNINAVYVDGAISYHADYINPYWSASMKLVAQIDNHLFYKNM